MKFFISVGRKKVNFEREKRGKVISDDMMSQDIHTPVLQYANMACVPNRKEIRMAGLIVGPCLYHLQSTEEPSQHIFNSLISNNTSNEQ